MGKIGERKIQASQGAVALRNGAVMQVNSLQALPACQRQGSSAAAKHLAGAARNRLSQFGQTYAGADFHRQGHQCVGPAVIPFRAQGEPGEIG